MLPVYSYRVEPRAGGYVIERTSDDPANHYARWALVARAATHEEALELLADYEREEEQRRSAFRALFAGAVYDPGPRGTKL